ncbi:MAG: CPBP family intramembrane metalloprotease [Prevotella histicola]|nr:CPBP family intramembrane metalloprotease [Prevotella histicola]
MKDHKNIKLWRDIIFVIGGIILFIIYSTILSLGIYTASESDFYLINIPIFLITAVVLLLLYNLLIRYVEANDACKIAPRKDISSIGNGLFIGFSYFIIVTVTMSLCGYYHIKSIQFDWEKQLFSFTLFFLVAVSEEIFFRGILFRMINRRWNIWAALVISALIFGGLHIFNDNATLWSSIAIAIEAGSLLGAAYAYSKNIWLPIGIHWIWNYTQGNILGFPVSGEDNVTSIITPEISGPQWLTGGSFGAEASVISAVIGLLISLWFIRKTIQQGYCEQ